MFNKNIIVGLVVVVLFGGGIAFYFLNGNGATTTSSPVVKNGELTRELAKQIIIKQFGADSQKWSDRITVTGVSMQSETKAMVSVNVKYDGTGYSGEVPKTVTFYLYDGGWNVDISTLIK